VAPLTVKVAQNSVKVAQTSRIAGSNWGVIFTERVGQCHGERKYKGLPTAHARSWALHCASFPRRCGQNCTVLRFVVQSLSFGGIVRGNFPPCMQHLTLTGELINAITNINMLFKIDPTKTSKTYDNSL